jgi:hypothetical protein
MKPAWIAGGVALAAILGVGAWQGFEAGSDGRASAQPAPAPASSPNAAADQDDSPSGVVTIDTPGDVAAEQGTTPMAQRVAVLGLLNKRNGKSQDLTLRPGQAVRISDAVVRLRACEETAPWEQDHYTGAFVQLDVQQFDKSWRRVFSGWLYKERPGLNVVQNPIYDVWTKSCKMSRPDSGPDTVSVADVDKTAASSVKKSTTPAANGGDDDGAADDAVSVAPVPPSAPVPVPSAAPSNAR